jgi:glycosyltransferase involved in cell wall biosynthesis
VVVEGMLAGRPVIAARAGGLPEIIENGVSGILITPESPNELTEALRLVFSDAVAAATMAENGQGRARACFSDERMRREIEQNVGEILLAS